MKHVLLIFLGGGVGSVLRYLISSYFNSSETHLYLGTFLVNIIGCLILGIILGLSLKYNWMSTETTLLLGVGFCGGFTTFSSFGFEMYTLLKGNHFGMFFLYSGASLVVGFTCVVLGLWLSRAW